MIARCGLWHSAVSGYVGERQRTSVAPSRPTAPHLQHAVTCARATRLAVAAPMADASPSHDKHNIPSSPSLHPLGGGGGRGGALPPASLSPPDSSATRHVSTAPSPPHPYNFRIVKEELSYSRYINVFNRVVELPEPPPPPPGRTLDKRASVEEVGGERGRGRTVEYDVVGANTVGCQFVAVVPYHSATKSVTLIREYAQGPNDLVYTVPCGGVGQKHTSLEDAAQQELSEEAHLCGGKWVKLLPDGHPGLLEVKWCKNRFTPFLVIDPEADGDPRPKDAEEFIEVVEVALADLRRVMYNGDMMLPSVVTCDLALDYLERNGHL